MIGVNQGRDKSTLRVNQERGQPAIHKKIGYLINSTVSKGNEC